MVEQEIHIIEGQLTILQQLPDAGMSPWTKIYKTSLKVYCEELHQKVPVRAPDLSILSSYRGKRQAIHSYLCLCFTQWSMPTLG